LPKRVINRSSLSEQVCDFLKESISSGKYRDGEKLPSEKELTEIFSVSRLTVRAAIQRLNALGLVTTKAGDGTYVNELNVEKYLKDSALEKIHPKTLQEVQNFRKLIDLECIRLAIQNASDEEMEQLDTLSDIYTENMTGTKKWDDEGIKRMADNDFKIHLKICELSKNSLYVLSYLAAEDIIKSFLYTIIKLRHERYTELGRIGKFYDSLRSHTGLIEVIKKRDFNKAKKLFLNHIDYTVLNLSPEDLIGTDWLSD